MNESKSVNLNIPVATAHLTMLVPTVAVREYRATRHLWAARRAARECREVEDRLVGTKQASIELETAATNAVLLSVAFMEAQVNEFMEDLVDSTDRIGSRCAGIDLDTAALIQQLWAKPSALERASVLDKYQVALTAARKPPLAKGENPYQAASQLIDLRNLLVHFKPEWQVSDTKHKTEQKLKGNFADSKLFPDGVSPWFPIGCLATGCAEWAHTSATAFVDAWWERIGLTWNYHDTLLGTPEP